eukprot:9237092-Pyramimonas_sp.AAC.1
MHVWEWNGMEIRKGSKRLEKDRLGAPAGAAERLAPAHSLTYSSMSESSSSVALARRRWRQRLTAASTSSSFKPYAAKISTLVSMRLGAPLPIWGPTVGPATGARPKSGPRHAARSAEVGSRSVESTHVRHCRCPGCRPSARRALWLWSVVVVAPWHVPARLRAYLVP